MIATSSWLGWIADQSFQLTIVAGVVWLITSLWASNRPHLAHALWVLVLIKCVLPPISSPTGLFGWVDANTITSGISTAVDRVSLQEHLPDKPATWIDIKDQNSEATKAQSLLLPRDSRITTRPTGFQRLCGFLPALVLTGAFIRGVWISVQYILFLRTIRIAKSALSPDLGDTLERLRKRLGIRRRVSIWILDQPIGPAVIGLLRPTILLPKLLFDGRSASQLEPLLTHELIHIRRGDLFWAMLQAIATSLWWFHPLVWLAAKMTTRESELCCDEETIAALKCSPATYARELLNVLERKHLLRVAPALPGVRPVDVTRKRLERIMNLGQGSHLRTPWSAWGIAAIAGFLLLPSSARLGAQQENAKRETSTGPGSVQAKQEQTGNVPEGEPQKPISMQVRFVKMPSTVFATLNVKWSLADAVQIPDGSKLESETERPASSAPVVHASSIERNLPVLYAILNVADTDLMLQQIQKVQRNSIQRPPRVSFSDGQKVSMSDSVATPYAIGNNKVKVVDVGTHLDLYTSLIGNGSINLKCDLSISTVGDYETVAVQLNGDSRTSLRIPEVEKTRIQCA